MCVYCRLMTTLAFLPGHMCDSRAWTPVATRLADAGYDICHISLNAAGHVDELAHHVLRIIDGPIVPIGFSMGAIVALAMHRASPDRLSALCLAGVNASADLPDRSAARIVHQQRVRDGQLLEIVRDAFIPAYFAEENHEAKSLHDLCLAMATEVGPDVFIRQSEALRTRPDAQFGLSAITCPTLVIGGEEDRLCPPDWHRATAANIAGAKLEIMPGGHMALIERPDDMAMRIGNWLSTITGKEDA